MGKSVKVSWTTANESANEYFAVERSQDGRHFREVGRVSGAGNSTSSISYAFMDEAPLAGSNYYRLRQTDFGGTQEVFGPVMVNMAGLSAKAYPNPVQDRLFVSGAAAEATATITDFNGRILARVNNLGGGIDVSTLATGAYLLRVESPAGAENFRFVRQ
ncbi:T9SS type A sorting domain-containing protein [Neolewinella lacunae]|uniref:T9SS type A sorting domain-containing protein n=1 Tax=Neolewinella lacunae TaxID=1517758 RepID=A0A923PP55_9BACT|nr:T9SS type A sorting domain-containing protein [Neolewinella lacunae]MBC6996306.1 T9SS type A sorting domain-containing protein [Neolewinella lacunae]MDN3636929.1 T9SS type A sorting domain-containing protein [Neolewinella lacunae]